MAIRNPGSFAMRVEIFTTMAIGLVLAACAGRDAQPVATVQPQDAYSDCSMINAEIQANNGRAQALASEQNAKIAQNVAAGVVGIVVWPVWFAMDAKGAAGTEAAALQARQEYLVNLAGQRCASRPPQSRIAAPPPPPPAVAQECRTLTDTRVWLPPCQ
jgi:hypothetical protein